MALASSIIYNELPPLHRKAFYMQTNPVLGLPQSRLVNELETSVIREVTAPVVEGDGIKPHKKGQAEELGLACRYTEWTISSLHPSAPTRGFSL